MLPHHNGYQGNAWMLYGVVFSIVMICFALYQTRQKQKAGIPVHLEFIVGWCILLSIFGCYSLYEVFTHPSKW